MRWFKRNGIKVAIASILSGAMMGLLGGTVLFTQTVRAKVAPSVYLDGREIPGLRAIYGSEGRLIVPMRLVFEGLGAQVFWDPGSHTARAFLDDHVVTLQADNPTGFRDGEAVKLDVPATIINDRMYIPLRFAGESLGGEVAWDGEKQVARINLGDMTIHVLAATTLNEETDQPDIPQPPAPVIQYTTDELSLMRRVVNAEAFGEPFEGKVAVAAVIINIAHSNGETLMQTLQNCSRFTVVCKEELLNRPPQKDVDRAVDAALHGEDPTSGALHFNATRFAQGGYWNKLRRQGWKEIRIGRQSFFRPPSGI